MELHSEKNGAKLQFAQVMERKLAEAAGLPREKSRFFTFMKIQHVNECFDGTHTVYISIPLKADFLSRWFQKICSFQSKNLGGKMNQEMILTKFILVQMGSQPAEKMPCEIIVFLWGAVAA